MTKASFRRRFVETAEELSAQLEALGSPEAIGLDVEMGQRLKRLPNGVTKGEQLLALIQIAGNGRSLIIDPLRIRDLSPLKPLMASDTLKVVLGGATDIQLLEDHGLPVHHIVDLGEVAISVFGHKEEGMRALADRALGVQIDKSIRREDWLRRPINPSMLSYAHQDAELTLRLYYWFLQEHPEAVESHARKRFHPALSEEIAEWIRKFLTKRIDLQRLFKELAIDPDKREAELIRDVRLAESHVLSPGQKRRLIRLIGDLGKAELVDDILPYLNSPSAVFRAGASRALGKLNDKRALPFLERLTHDPIADVSSAAEAAVAELKQEQPKGKAKASDETDMDEASTRAMDPSALAALKRLRGQLPDEAGPPAGPDE